MSTEIHQNLEQTTIYQIETVSIPELNWLPLSPRQVRVDGKFLVHNPEYKPLVHCDKRVLAAYGDNMSDMLAFVCPDAARKLARKLASVWDRPMRVMKVQRIRIQKQEGKLIFPTGGL